MVRGAVPGAKGGWVTISDAVKKPVNNDAPAPASLKGSVKGNENVKMEQETTSSDTATGESETKKVKDDES